MGLLLNVDYDDPLAKIRARDVLRRLPSAKYVGEEEAIDAFYLHYRSPIFGGRASNEVWARFVKTYAESNYYKTLGPMCRLNPRASREAAVRLLRAYQAFLDSLEAGRGRFWLGRGLWLKWSEALRNIRRLMGDPAEAERLYASLKKLAEVLGTGRSGDPASLAISVAADPARVRLADVIADVADLASKIGVEDPDEGDGVGAISIDGVRYGSVSALRKATSATKALYNAARALFAYKLATSTLSAKLYSMNRRPPLYILLDKSGSMYNVVPGLGVRRISIAAALAIALWRRSKGSLLRLFDVDVHKPEAEDVMELLLRVAPSGGTSISKAISAAAEEVARLGRRRYRLIVITDGEDDSLDAAVFERAKEAFTDVEMYLVGRKEVKGVRFRDVLASLPLQELREHAEYDYGEAYGGHEIADQPKPYHLVHDGLLPKARGA